MNTIKLKKGFTLVELLVVIAIIGILATLLLLQLNVARAKARDTKRIGDVTQIRTAIELYYDAKGAYPPDLDPSINEFMATQKAPVDPTTGSPYGYGIDVATGKYQVWTQLEQQNANAFKTDADIPAGLPGGTNGAAEAGGTGGKCTAPGVGASDCVFDLGVN